MNNTISIKRMFVIMTGILFGVTVLSILGGLYGLSHFRGALEAADSSNVLLRAQTEGEMMHDAMRADYFAGMLAAERDDATEKKAIREEFAEHRKKWDEALSTMKQAATSPELMRAVADVEPPIKSYVAESNRLIDLALTDPAGARAKIGDFGKMFSALKKQLGDLTALIAKDANGGNRRILDSFSNASTMVMVGGALLLLVVALVVGWAGSIIKTQTKTILDTARDLSSGEADLTRRIPTLTGELGKLSGSMNTFIAQLHDIISSVAKNAVEIANAARQISAGNTDLSARTEEQASTLEETASSMQEFASSVRQTADNTKTATTAAQRAIDAAKNGSQIVADATQHISQVKLSSKRISEITSIIDAIAFQTNILALNAAVEAARAGEQGRGFAVVASEVRALAQRSAASAKDIKGLIDDAVKNVESGSELMIKAGEAMDGIMNANQSVLETSREINLAANEQATGVDQVNRAIIQLEETTQQNAALVEQSAAAAESMREQAESLQALVSRFKLGNSQSASAASVTVREAPSAKPRSSGSRALATRSAPRKSPALGKVDEGEWEEF